MRVISGKYRGRPLATITNNSIRPTTDRVKENLFNILMPYMQNSVFLDLFCGSGSIGIEAISRGAQTVVFNDMHPKSIQILKKNLAFIEEKVQISMLDFRVFLKTCHTAFENYIYTHIL